MKIWVQRGKHRVRILPSAVRHDDVIFTPVTRNESIVLGPLRVICDPLIFDYGIDIPVHTDDSAKQYFEICYRRD